MIAPLGGPGIDSGLGVLQGCVEILGNELEVFSVGRFDAGPPRVIPLRIVEGRVE